MGGLYHLQFCFLQMPPIHVRAYIFKSLFYSIQEIPASVSADSSLTICGQVPDVRRQNCCSYRKPPFGKSFGIVVQIIADFL